MAHFELSQVIKSEAELSSGKIIEFIKRRLASASKYRTLSETGNSLQIKGRIRERVFTPVVKYTANITVETNGEKAKVLVGVDTKPNLIFFAMLLFGLPLCIIGIGFPIVIVTLVLWAVQKSKPQKAIEDLLRTMTTEFSF